MRKRIAIISVIIVIILLAFVYFFVKNNDNNQSTSQAEQSIVGEGEDIFYSGTSVEISNKDNYKNRIDESYFNKLELIISDFIGQDKGKNIGKIRDNSLSSKLENGVYTHTFILDFEALKKSWGVDVSTGNENEPNPVWIYCLDSKNLIYGDFECRGLDDQ